MLIKPYDTESKSRNVLASPLGEEGHEVAKGWTVVRMIMVFLFYVLSPPNVFAVHRFDQGGRRLAVRTAMEHPIGALPRTPFPASRDFPSRGNERYEGKNSESYTSRTISAFSPFGGWRHHLARWEACHMTQKANPVTLIL